MDAPSKLKYSQRLIRKGVLVEETYRVFSHWDERCSLQENIEAIRANNPIGARNMAWLREITATISNRFSSGDPFLPLVVLAKGGLSVDIWKYCLLWHLGTTDGLYSSFVSEFLFPRIEEGIAVFTTDDVIPFVRELESQGVLKENLSDYGVRRLGRDLLRATAEFGFFRGTTRRELCHPPIPDNAFLFATYSLGQQVLSAERLISSDRWRLFLMRPYQVEQELLNLHQFHRLRYERAGTVRDLSLPYASLNEFAQSLVS